MLPRPQFLIAALVSTALAGCASAPQTTPAPQPANTQSATGYPTMKRWTGTLTPSQSYNAAAVSSNRQNAYGHVDLEVLPSNPMLTHVTITVSVPAEPGLDYLGWGISQGNCGSGNPPVLSLSAFPVIQLSANSQGKADAKIPFVLPDNGIYHLNVFHGAGTQLSNVMTCAQLRRRND